MFKALFVALLLPGFAMASKGGGGGIGIACYKNGDLTSVELLDLYEARINGLEIQKNYSGDLKKDIFEVATKIYKDSGAATAIAKKVERVILKYRFLPKDSDLELTNDAYPVSKPKECRFQQIANYYNDNLIWVDQVLFDKLSYEGQLALAFHEFIYSSERLSDKTDSRYTRTIIGLAFSTNDPFQQVSYSRVFPGTHICHDKEYKNTFFHASRINIEKNIWRFSFTKVNGHTVFSAKTADFSIFPDSPLGDYRKDYKPEVPEGWDFDFGYSDWKSSKPLRSLINDNEMATVESSKNSMKFSWVGTDPGDEVKELELVCVKNPFLGLNEL